MAEDEEVNGEPEAESAPETPDSGEATGSAESAGAGESPAPDETPEADDAGSDSEDSGTDGAPEEAAAEEPKAEDRTADKAEEAEKPKAKDLPPGADLEPISLEPEVELDAEEKAAREAEAEEKAAREAELALEEEGEGQPIAAAGVTSLPKDTRIQATGKRKRSVARVVILPGNGTITVNGREFDEYFPRARHRTVVNSPLVATGLEGKVEVRVLVQGGGVSGQAGATRHGIARGLTEAVPELRPELKRRGFLTRDSRAKERRKAGLKKARKRPQFSKR